VYSWKDNYRAGLITQSCLGDSSIFVAGDFVSVLFGGKRVSALQTAVWDVG
jgi:hypothetical protein